MFRILLVLLLGLTAPALAQSNYLSLMPFATGAPTPPEPPRWPEGKPRPSQQQSAKMCRPASEAMEDYWRGLSFYHLEYGADLTCGRNQTIHQCPDIRKFHRPKMDAISIQRAAIEQTFLYGMDLAIYQQRPDLCPYLAERGKRAIDALFVHYRDEVPADPYMREKPSLPGAYLPSMVNPHSAAAPKPRFGIPEIDALVDDPAALKPGYQAQQHAPLVQHSPYNAPHGAPHGGHNTAPYELSR